MVYLDFRTWDTDSGGSMTRKSSGRKRVHAVRAETLDEAIGRAERIMKDNPGAGVDVRVLAGSPGQRRLHEVSRLIAVGPHDYRATLAFAFQDKAMHGDERARVTLRPVMVREAYGTNELLTAVEDWAGPVEFSPVYRRQTPESKTWVAHRPEDRAGVLAIAQAEAPLGIHRVIAL